MSNIAVYTAIYPGVERYLRDWFASLRAQTDRDFQLWVSLDGISASAVQEAFGAQVEAVWVENESGDTPAQVRQRAFERIVERHEAVVFVDSDDILHPARVAAARAALRSADLVACALRLVDQTGRDLGTTLSLPAGASAQGVLPRHNIFGLSNTAYSTELLRRCLPIPREVAIVDWFLASRAWLMGARVSFDPNVGMDYRQHGSNMVRVLPPFSEARVREDTEHVRKHFRLLSETMPAGVVPERVEEMQRVAQDVEQFHQRVVSSGEQLSKYVSALNDLVVPPLWWTAVAHPSLARMWAD